MRAQSSHVHRRCSHRGPPSLFERVHDVRVVCAPARPVQPPVVSRRDSQLGDPLFEYLLQVPANRIGFRTLSLAQLKVMQEVITLCVFAPFAVLYMRQPISLNYLWAGLCLMGAVYFVFK